MTVEVQYIIAKAKEIERRQILDAFWNTNNNKTK